MSPEVVEIDGDLVLEPELARDVDRLLAVERGGRKSRAK